LLEASGEAAQKTHSNGPIDESMLARGRFGDEETDPVGIAHARK